MIETPVKPPPAGGPPAAPPPDARMRVMEPPPDPASRYEFGCRECGAPLHADQAACLTCGAMVEDGEGGITARRAVTGSAVAVLLLGGAVGAAIAGLPNGKHVGKGPIAQVFGKPPKTLPPATITPTPRGGSGTTPLTGSPSPKKPPPIHKTSTVPKTTSSPTTNTSSSGGGGGGSSQGSSNSGKQKPHKKPTKKPPSLTLFTTGEPAADAGLLANGPQTPDNASDTIDSDVGTAWAGKPNAGVWVKPQNSGNVGLGLVSKTPHYGVSVYYTTQASPPADRTGWTFISSTNDAGKKERFDLSGEARNALYYLVVIDSGPVKLAEIQPLRP